MARTARAAPGSGAPPAAPSLLRKLAAAVAKGVLAYLVLRWAQSGPRCASAAAHCAALFGPPARTAPAIPAEDALVCAWRPGQRADLRVYLSPHKHHDDFAAAAPVFVRRGVVFSPSAGRTPLDADLEYTPPAPAAGDSGGDAQIYAHVYLVREGAALDAVQAQDDPASIVYGRVALVSTMAGAAPTANLIAGAPPPAAAAGGAPVPHWYPELRVSLVDDLGALRVSALPPHLRRHVSVVGGAYLPVLYTNDFWQMRDRRVPIASLPVLPLRIVFAPMSTTRFHLLANFAHSLRINESLFGGDGETEKLKQMIFDTNPYLLATTLAVSLLHSLFDILAFKNDIQFWRERRNLEGLSVRSVLLNAAFQFVIFLYLLDQETSWLILVSVAVGTAIEAWKITRVLSVRVYLVGVLPRIEISDHASYAATATREHDEAAMRYLLCAAVPLLAGYSAYSLLYQSHKGWYSWLLGNLVGFVYTFGFITMTPQLFINYKLKSVAHIPWRVFVYKALNTFIDDLFAFVIKMPTLHRLACFRDDIVFLVYLYQRWIYPVDRARPNEFGQVFSAPEPEPEPEADRRTGRPAGQSVASDRTAAEAEKTLARGTRARRTAPRLRDGE